MNNKLKFAKYDLSPLEELLWSATDEIEAAQTNYDDALDLYVEKRATIELNALSEKYWTDKDNNPRSASNDAERRGLQKHRIATDEELAKLRKDMQAKRRILRLWQSREKNARLILSSRVGDTV